MATNKVLFGKGKLANVLKQFANPTAGMVAFGSADVTDEFKGGAIIADGQLVSSRLIDYKLSADNSTLTLYYVDSESGSIKSQGIPLKQNLTPEEKTALTNEIKEAVLNDVAQDLTDPSTENGRKLVEAVSAKVTESIAPVSEWALGDVVTAGTGSCITVTKTGEDGKPKSYQLGLSIDSETLEITTDGVLKAKFGKDVYIQSGQVITKEDGSKVIELTLNDSETNPTKLEIPADSLIPVYKAGNGIAIADDLTISINTTVTDKIDKMYTDLYGSNVPGEAITPSLSDQVRTNTTSLGTINTRVAALETAVNGEGEGNGLSDRIDGLTTRVDALENKELLWSDLDNPTTGA